MINLVNGYIGVGEEEFGFESTRAEIGRWIVKNELERIGPTDKEWCFYRLREELDHDTPVDVVLKVENSEIQTITVRRVNGLDRIDAVENAGLKFLMQEFNFLIAKVRSAMKRDPDLNRIRECKWSEKWGDVSVSVEPNASEVAIFMNRRKSSKEQSSVTTKP